MNTRRQFLITASMSAVVSACRKAPQSSAAPPPTPGAPPTFGTGPLSGPPVCAATFAEAEKLAQVTMSPAEREMAAASWQRSMAPFLERRVGPRKVTLDATVAPATQWNPAFVGGTIGPSRDQFVRSRDRRSRCPATTRILRSRR